MPAPMMITANTTPMITLALMDPTDAVPKETKLPVLLVSRPMQDADPTGLGVRVLTVRPVEIEQDGVMPPPLEKVIPPPW